jgi:hypothetical protein
MSTANPTEQASYQPQRYSAPKRSWWSRLNFRVVIFCAVIGTLVIVPTYIWLDELITGGVHPHGTYTEVDLKAMSTFDMDQTNGTLQDVPARFRALEGKEVLMIGEMWVPNFAGEDDLNGFTLVYSRAKCCYGGPPLPQCAVDATVIQGKHAIYTDLPVKVWGKLHLEVTRAPGGLITAVYHVVVEKLEAVDS